MSPAETPRLLTSGEAAAELGVSRETLYSYVSRRLLASKAHPTDPRRSLFETTDVKRLAEQVRRRSRHAVALSTLDFGEPVLNSAITRIEHGTLLYRGCDAIGLSATASLEEIASLLWQCPTLPALPPGGLAEASAVEPHGADPHGWCISAAADLVQAGPWTSHRERALDDAAVVLRQLARAAVGASVPQHVVCGPIHRWMGASWSLDETGADLVRQALVLSADHELNPSTYAARVVASTRAPLGACVLAGLCALIGPRHGGVFGAIRSILNDPDIMGDPARMIAARRARGERTPGFGHRLYPKGDPRAEAILARIGVPTEIQELIRAMETASGQKPVVDFALVVLERVLKLPEGAAFAMFAIGRVAGWIAHVFEQWEEDRIIRPRAAYAGP